jgi:cobalt-zinc-cadmium efflux system protein
MVAEVITGLLTGSLVLIADAGHMLTDVAGLSMALFAAWFALRPANERKTFGYHRIEILAALFNALLLVAVSGYIMVEALRRFQEPTDVPGVPLLVVASAGLAINVLSAALLMEGARESINMRAAFLDVVGDAIGSIGAIAAGVIIITTGWPYADPIFAVAVALLILPRTWTLLKAAIDILLEGTPSHLEIASVQQSIAGLPGVRSVHDLHIWTVTSGFVALSGHVEAADGVDRDELLVDLRSALAERYGIEHVTIQIESERLAHSLDQPCFPGQTPCYGSESIAATAASATTR